MPETGGRRRSASGLLSGDAKEGPRAFAKRAAQNRGPRARFVPFSFLQFWLDGGVDCHDAAHCGRDQTIRGSEAIASTR